MQLCLLCAIKGPSRSPRPSVLPGGLILGHPRPEPGSSPLPRTVVVPCSMRKPREEAGGHDHGVAGLARSVRVRPGHGRCILKWQLSGVASVALLLHFRCFAQASTFTYTSKPASCARSAPEFRLAQMRRGYCMGWVLPTNWRCLAYGQVHIIKGAGMM